jgi:hypothetical protein
MSLLIDFDMKIIPYYSFIHYSCAGSCGGTNELNAARVAGTENALFFSCVTHAFKVDSVSELIVEWFKTS